LRESKFIVRGLIEAPSLKVPKSLGEKAIRVANELGLLNKSLKVRSEGDFLHIPLTEEPTPPQISFLSGKLPEFKVVRYLFQERVRKPRKAIDIAAERLPPYLLASFPRSIDIIGHVAIVEIPPELKDYKRVVGEAILEAHRQVRTVLAKIGAVSGVHRVREFEVIAGSGETETVHREHGCVYHLDPRKVYFSPRLSYEHNRVASQVRAGETVVDMFAGVGPFSILIAKRVKDIRVYAIDVNPEAYRYLKRNIIANGVQGRVTPILGDVRVIIPERLRGVADRVIMNLPERALEYIDLACESLRIGGGIIHYYCFAGGEESITEAKEKLIREFGGMRRRIERILTARIVREVAPYKWQVAIDLEVR